MSEQRFKLDLLLQLLSLCQRHCPIALERILSRSGFRDGDITFRRTASGKHWTEVHCWPWERDE